MRYIVDRERGKMLVRVYIYIERERERERNIERVER